MPYSMFQIALSCVESLLERSIHLALFLKRLYCHVFGNLLTVQFFLINGLVKNTNYSITTLFIGPEESAYQFAHLGYSEIERIKPIGKHSFRSIDLSHLQDVKIIVVNIKECLMGKFLKQGYLLLPNVTFNLSLRGSIDQIIRRSSRRRRRSIKKLQNFNYAYTISRNKEEDFDFFYWKMYLPYTKKRFGRAAIESPHLMLKTIYKRNGGVVFVRKGEERVAGLLFWIKRKTLYVKSLGILEANQKFVTELAGQAALFFLIKWAKVRGIESLNYGVTMPFFRNGIFTFKKEWGMYIQPHTEQPFCALKFNRLNESALSFLQHNPFIYFDKGVMKGVFFVNYRPTKLELQQIFSKHFLQRLGSLVVIAYYRHNKKVANKTESSMTSEIFTDDLLQPLSNICLSLRKLGFLVEVHEFKRQKCASLKPSPLT